MSTLNINPGQTAALGVGSCNSVSILSATGPFTFTLDGGTTWQSGSGGTVIPLTGAGKKTAQLLFRSTSENTITYQEAIPISVRNADITWNNGGSQTLANTVDSIPVSPSDTSTITVVETPSNDTPTTTPATTTAATTGTTILGKSLTWWATVILLTVGAVFAWRHFRKS